ncbi:MAG: CDP-alcohol phosphatidyltransferase family protein [Candidatus Dependentiae bacterium]
MSYKRMQWQKLKKIHIRLFRDIPAHELRITIPTMLTILRIVFVPCIIVSMFMQQWGMAFLFFLTASITDFLDGNLARLWNEKTFLGACLDPIADKLLLISFFFTLVFIKTPLFSVPLWFVLLVLLKELIVIFGAMFILFSGRHLDVRPTWLGKSTTVVQMVFIIWLFACYYFHWVPVKTYYSMLAIMLLMVFLSFVQYIRIGFKQTAISS